MKKIKILLLFIVILIFPSYVFSQKENVFQPAFWMYNFVSKDSLKDIKLNSHLPLMLNSNTNWYTKNKTKDRNTLFIVYKSNSSDSDLISVIGNKRALFINPVNIKLADTLDISGYNENFGELLDLKFGDVGKGIILLNNNLKDSYIYEMILENNLSNEKINEVRTYLSIKYGIDLIDSNQYSYRNNKLWNKSKNNDNIFGIGKFNYFNLLQKESIHSKDKDLELKFSNDSIISQLGDGDFVLLGNNSKSLNFKNNSCLKRWTIQSNITTKIDIVFSSVNTFGKEFNYEYYILVNGKKYEATYLDNKITFKEINIDSSMLDVELIRSKLDIDLNVYSDCDTFFVEFDKSKIKENIHIFNEIGDLVYNEKYTELIKISTERNNYFDIEFNFKGTQFKKRYYTNYGDFPITPVKTNYYLGENSIEILPKIESKNTYTYSWFRNDILFYEGEKVSINDTGYYTLVITDSSGCSKQYEFDVSNKPDEDNNNSETNWTIYPNPAIVNSPIFNSFNFSEPRFVELHIFSLDGKLIKTLPKKQIKNDVIIFDIQSSGTYMVVAYIDDVIEIKKIIVQ